MMDSSYQLVYKLFKTLYTKEIVMLHKYSIYIYLIISIVI